MVFFFSLVGFGAIIITSLGTVAGAFNSLNNYRKITPSTENSNIPVGRLLDTFTFENLGDLSNAIAILLGLTILLFVGLVSLLLLERNLPLLDLKKNFITKDVSQENMDWVISKIKSFLTNNLSTSKLIIFTVLILFNLCFSFYFILDIAEFVSRIHTR